MSCGFVKTKKFLIFAVGAAIVIVTVALCATLIPRAKMNNVTVTAQQFPTTFKFGSASASYQVEGAWDADGKGLSVWDDMTHRFPERISDRSSGDESANSYEFYKEDVKALVAAGLNYYRFSISWPRVLPDGDISSVNERGLQYYDDLINELVRNKIEPMVTMFHWDLPKRLQDLGGMANPIIVDYFERYAELLFKRYADRVKVWFTFNEPSVSCEYGHGNLIHAPLVDSPGIGDYLCGHHVLLANARAYRLYHNYYNPTKTGKIGIVLNSYQTWPKDPNNPEDVAAANRTMEFWFGWFANPIFSSTGDYSSVLKDIINENSRLENRSWSRLPEFTPEEIRFVHGTSDFLGLNYYTANFATTATDLSEWPNPSYYRDQRSLTTQNETWPVAQSQWLRSAPQGLRDLLNFIKNKFNNPEVMITENGWSDDGSDLQDTKRIEYLRGHLQAVLDAILRDRCNVVAHTTWSIIDNFEWTSGYTERFGLFHVDFNSPNKTRTAKASVEFLRSVIKTRMIPSE